MATDRKDTGIQTSLRLDPWIRAEIEKLAESRGITFTDMVNHLLEYQLNQMGFSKAKYEAEIFKLPRTETIESGLKTGDVKIDGDMNIIAGHTGNVNNSKQPFTPADNIGKSGDILNQVEKLSEKEAVNLLSKIKLLLENRPKDGKDGDTV